MNVVRRSRFGRFIGVGSLNTAIDVLLYSLLAAVGLPTLLANGISTCAGLAFSFVANRRFTFDVRRAVAARDVVVFVGVTGAGLWALQPLVILLVSPLVPASVPPVIALLGPKLCAVAVGVVWNWVWYSRVLFRVPEQSVGDTNERTTITAVS